jgi:starvation-inducible DNA-binding protein
MSLSTGESGESQKGSTPEENKTEGSMGIGHCIKMFNGLLSDLKVYEQNLQGLHWIVKGPNFFALHTVYGDMYTAVGCEIDIVAEKIRAMGGEPVHCFDCFTGHAEMGPIVGISNETKGVVAILKCIDYLIKKETDMAVMLEKHADSGMPEFVYGGVDMLGTMLSCLEKSRWQLNMFLGEEVSVEKGDNKDGNVGEY